MVALLLLVRTHSFCTCSWRTGPWGRYPRLSCDAIRSCPCTRAVPARPY